MARAVSVSELAKKRFVVMPFTGKWKESFGEPERAGSWIIWGQSGNGKTRFALQLCKYLTRFGKVAYNSLEEGTSRTMQVALQDARMHEVGRHFLMLDREPVDELRDRLKKHKSPHIIVIDSVQYTGMNYQGYKRLKEEFPKKLFIFISHAEGKNPAGKTADSIRYDANIKMRIEGYMVFPQGRDVPGEPFISWPEGAANYWGDQILTNEYNEDHDNYEG